jgi:hypothetical protein
VFANTPWVSPVALFWKANEHAPTFKF